MPIYAKVGSSSWSTNAKKVWVKATDGWKSGTKLFAKTIAGWVQMWPGDAPASSLTDPIDIRLTGYNGPRATSPQPINTVLYGNDGTITGATPITVTNRRMYISEDNSGNTTRYQLETTDIFNLTSNAEANIGYKRFYADGWWLFYQLTASNSSGSSVLYSPAIKIIKRIPLVNSSTLSEDYSTESAPAFVLQASISDLWYQSVDTSRSYVRWWRNTSKSPGGTQIKTTYLDSFIYPSSATDTRSGDYEDYNGTGTNISIYDEHTEMGGVSAGNYIIAEMVLINSYTDHNSSPVSSFKTTGDNPVITSVSIQDERGQTVVDNSLLPDQYGSAASPSYIFSGPRIISDGFLNFYLTVTGATANTVYRLEPRIYNWLNGTYLRSDTGAAITTDPFPLNLDTPYSVTLNGDIATVRYRTFINADAFASGPTYDGGKARYQYEFRLSTAKTSGGTRVYYTGVADLGFESVYVAGIDGGGIEVAPSTVPTLNATPTTGASPLTVTFSGSATSYPSGYASYPRSYIIDFGDGTANHVINHSTNTSNPSFSGVTHQYSNTGAYTATLYTIPQGDASRGTRARTISIGSAPATPTGLSATTTRSDGVQLTWNAVSGATSYELWYGSPPLTTSTPDFFPGNNTTYLDTAIGSGSTRTYYVRARNDSGVSAWSSGVSGTRAAAVTPTITALSASAPSTASTQLVTVTVNWSSTNQASYFLNVLQTQVANYLDYGTTETSSNTSDSGSNFNVYSGASVTITLTVYGGPNQTGTSATSQITYTPPLLQTTYGPCEFWYSNSSYQCIGTENRNYTTTYYKRKVYVGGSWDGSTYDYSESACASSTSFGAWQYTDGRCGHTTPTYRYYCRANYYQAGIPDDLYTSSSDESQVVCASVRIVCSYNNTGSYPAASNPPACPTTTWYCTESYNGGGVGNCGYSTSTFNNSASGSGYSRSCSTSGYPSCQSTNPAAPVCISYKYVCKYYDAYNSASNNYYTCYYEGECAANNNSDGSRSTCCAAYS